MRRTSLLLGLLLAGVTAAVFAGSSASSSVKAEQPAWFKVAVAATSTADVDGYLRGSVQTPTGLVGYIHVQATVENVGAIQHTGKVVLTVTHPTGELTRVLATRVTIAPASEFLRGSAPRAQSEVTYSATVPCDCPGVHTVRITASHVMERNDPATMQGTAPAAGSATTIVH